MTVIISHVKPRKIVYVCEDIGVSVTSINFKSNGVCQDIKKDVKVSLGGRWTVE